MSVVEAVTRDAAHAAPGHRRFTHVRALDGVRGLAVALVVAYHFLPDLVPAGFLGVDVFFVLSGFLLTSLALGEHERSGAVSAPAFFARRARRLLPAAVVTVLISVALAMALDPVAFRGSLRGEAVASLLYVNNWWAIAQDGTYQVVFGTESPLAHFWSLSIEEQFYIAFPLLLLALAAGVRRRGGSTRTLAGALLAVSSVGAVASAALMARLYEPLDDPSRLYYGTDTRGQAVLLGVAGGCAVWLWRERLTARVPGWVWTPVAIVGTAVVVVTALRAGFLEGWLYRGGFFVLAVVALVVVVAVVQHRGPAAHLFELGPLVTLGVFSYGIYLWHWPVKVFLDEQRTGLSGVALLVVRLAATALATWLSHRLVERPFRSARTGDASPRLAAALRSPRGAVVATVGVAVAVLVVWVIARPAGTTYANSVEAPTAVEQAPAAADGAAGGPTDASAVPTSPLRVMWTGDSVAWTLGGGQMEFPQSTGYETVFDPSAITLWNLGRYSCALLVAPSRSFGNARPANEECSRREEEWPARVAEFDPEAVVWSAALFDTNDVYLDDGWIPFGTPEWDRRYLESLDRARVAATVGGATFVVLGQNDPVPHPEEPHLEALRPEHVWRFGHLRDLQRRFAAEHLDDTRYVDLQELLCPRGSCPTTSVDGVVHRPDGLHWHVDGARTVTPTITAALHDALGRPRPTTSG